MTRGTIEAIFVCPKASGAMVAKDRAQAIAGKGLDGDRYAQGIGFYSNNPTTAGARELTLIDAVAIESVMLEAEIPFAAVESRRNIVTRGIDLDQLLGKRFAIGAAVCEGVRACPPCTHLEELTGKKVMRALIYTGGLRARIVESGELKIGDWIEKTGDAEGEWIGAERG